MLGPETQKRGRILSLDTVQHYPSHRVDVYDTAQSAQLRTRVPGRFVQMMEQGQVSRMCPLLERQKDARTPRERGGTGVQMWQTMENTRRS